jgi:probable HAF family extracellular repeat protein
MSDAGIVVGYSLTSGGNAHAFVWSASGGMRDIGTLGGPSSMATGVDGAGRVVGESLTSDGRSRAFVWTAQDGMRETNDAGGRMNGVLAVSRRGEVLGRSALQPTLHSLGDARR